MTIPKLFILLASAVLVSGTAAYAVDPDSVPNKPKLTWSGMVAGNAIYDTRQVVEAREGFLMLYPQQPILDKEGRDINAKPSYNQYAMTTRIRASLLAPVYKGFKSSAVIETDFTGASNSENNSLRLRHAYIKLERNNTKLLVGQFWHPLDIPEMIPVLVSLNTGAPFRSFSRQPQIRFDHMIHKMNVVLSFSTQRDYVSNGPSGQSYTYLRNSAFPNLHLQFQYAAQKIFAGIGADYKVLTPRLVTDSLFIAGEKTNCYAGTAFLKSELKKAGIKLQAIYGQGLNDHLMLGGYGISTTDTLTNRKTFTNLNYFSSFIHLYSRNEQFNYSIFGGYTKNMGSRKIITGDVYARDPGISSVWRLSPSFSYTWRWLMAAAELEYTRATWGTPDKYYKISENSEAGNWRFTLQLLYIF